MMTTELEQHVFEKYKCKGTVHYDCKHGYDYADFCIAAEIDGCKDCECAVQRILYESIDDKKTLKLIDFILKYTNCFQYQYTLSRWMGMNVLTNIKAKCLDMLVFLYEDLSEQKRLQVKELLEGQNDK